MGMAAALLNRKKNDGDKESEETRYRSVRNLADAVVTYESQYKLRYGVPAHALQLLIDARHVLDLLKTKVKFSASRCLRRHPQLLSSSQFKARHAVKFLQPYSSQASLTTQFSPDLTPHPNETPHLALL
jgi:hypothetical protein|tara:strand:+ start:1098 stop:1484 length:387 start_codon:yes stop_codon:yes gene_type:complete